MSTGKIGVSTGNLFPIIKKFLYSDHEIFLREIVSNAVDASQKMKVLASNGEFKGELGELKVRVKADKAAGTLTVSDNGIGMTQEEVEKYINQIAFSGAEEFMNKYKDNAAAIIGHFGLGFYSSFMVSDRVEIVTKSYKEGAKAVKWSGEGNPEYTLEETEKAERGTDIIMYISEEEKDFLEDAKVNELLTKYCKFLPIEIISGKKKEWKDGEYKDTTEDNVINDTNPAWTRKPADLTEEDYEKFYRELYPMAQDPLFHIHLNVDYPFNLKGILYFPKINMEYESIEGTIKLYNNQVFIADNIKEVIPEFLMVLKGVIDCPDLPLNVSRSALQNDGFVNKVADYISKKVADKLNGMFKTDRENYEKYWDDISPFIKFGCLKDEKFGEKMKDSMLYKNLEHKYLTLEDIIKEAKGEAEVEEAAKEEAAKNEESKAGNTEAEAKSEEAESTDADAEKEPEKTRIFYVTDEVQQSQYINMFKAQGQDAIILTHNIDSAFITYLEQKHQEVQFLRIDADVHDSLKDEVAEDEKEAFQKTAESLVEIFRKELGNDKLEVKVEKLKDDKVASMAVLSEENRRMQEMMKMYGMSGMDPSMFGSQATLVLNANHPLVQFLVEHKRSKNVPVICKQLYDLAMLAHKPLSPEEMTAFVQRSNEIMMLLTK